MKLQTKFSLACFLAYTAIAWIVRFDSRIGPHDNSLIYPFDTFSMYSKAHKGKKTAVIMVDTEKNTFSVNSFTSIKCQTTGNLEQSPCFQNYGAPYKLRDIEQHIRWNTGKGSKSVKLIQRAWEVNPTGPTKHISDCVLATCMVSR